MKRDTQICSTAETSALTGLSVHYLRRHAKSLGGIRLSPNGPWKFIPAKVRDILFTQPRGAACADPRLYFKERMRRAVHD